jgi:hypothetical protein
MKSTRLVVAAVIGISLAAVAHAEDSETIQRLERRIEELERKVQVLEENRAATAGRKNEQTTQLASEQTPPGETQQTSQPNVEQIQAATPTASTSPFQIPDFITGIRFQNDLRMRYDAIYPPSDEGFVPRWRLRPRLRLGGIATLKDDFEIGFRLASTPTVGANSGGDPLSTNQTFEDNASRKPVGVDWAFARWTPIRGPKWGGSFTLGKMENPPNYTEDVIDVDYTPEGLAEQFSFKASDTQLFTGYFGQYVLDEEQFSGKDPLLFLEQLHAESKWTQTFSTLFTVSGLRIDHPESLTTTNVPDSNHGNTRDANGVLVNQYRLLVVDGSFVFTLDRFPLSKGRFPIRLAWEYIHNYGADSNNIGYSYGPSFGRVSQTGRNQKGAWELSLRYQELQGDANYEEFTASDNGAFYRSRPVGEPYGTFRPTFLNGLNLRGYAFRLAYAPLDALVIDARLWRNHAIVVANDGDNPEGTRLLLDVVWKF